MNILKFSSQELTALCLIKMITIGKHKSDWVCASPIQHPPMFNLCTGSIFRIILITIYFGKNLTLSFISNAHYIILH